MYELAKEYLDTIGVHYDEEELKEVVAYQKARVPDYKALKKQKYYFNYNIPEYFDTYFLVDQRCKLSRIPQIIILADTKDYNGDKKTFAKEIIIYGRKSNRILYSVKWFNADTKHKKVLEVES